MKGIHCTRNTRQNPDCKFNVDCNNFKYDTSDYVKPLCPSKIENLPSCGINKSEARCKTLLCNYEQHRCENKRISDRNLPFIQQLPVEPYRAKYNICHSYVDLNSNENVNNDTPFKKKNSTSFYDFNIDIDSQIKYPPYSKCLDDPDISKNNTFNEPFLLSKKLSFLPPQPPPSHYDSCSLYKNNHPHLPNPDIPYNSQNIKCAKPTHHHEFSCSNQVNSEHTKTLLQFHYPPFDKPCNTGCLPHYTLPLPQNLPISYSSNVKSKFSIGPERENHLHENLFHNVTRRKHI